VIWKQLVVSELLIDFARFSLLLDSPSMGAIILAEIWPITGYSSLSETWPVIVRVLRICLGKVYFAESFAMKEINI